MTYVDYQYTPEQQKIADRFFERFKPRPVVSLIKSKIVGCRNLDDIIEQVIYQYTQMMNIDYRLLEEQAIHGSKALSVKTGRSYQLKNGEKVTVMEVFDLPAEVSPYPVVADYNGKAASYSIEGKHIRKSHLDMVCELEEPNEPV